jgi:hypothetical protein
VIQISDIAMPLMVVAVGALIWLNRRQPGAALLVGTLALMTGLIVTHKVGSPQFVAWIAPSSVVALCAGERFRFWTPVAVASLVTAALTGLLYPSGYYAFLGSSGLMLTVWTVRNLLLVAIFAAAVAELIRLWRSGRSAPAIHATGIPTASAEPAVTPAVTLAGPPATTPAPAVTPAKRSAATDPGAASTEPAATAISGPPLRPPGVATPKSS